jgi:hypothetical protein
MNRISFPYFYTKNTYHDLIKIKEDPVFSSLFIMTNSFRRLMIQLDHILMNIY